MSYDPIEPGAGPRHDAVKPDLRSVPRISVQGFCETAAMIEAVQEAASDRRMAKAHVKAYPGGLEGAIDFYEESPTPNVVILETRVTGQDLIDGLERLANVCDPGTQVVVVGHVNDVQIYRDLLRRGVSDYEVMPLKAMDVVRIVSELYSEEEGKPLGKSLVFIGSRGGAGSSTVAHNVAWSLSTSFETSTIMADFDLPFGTANLDFNQDPPQGVADAVYAPERLDDVFLDRILSKCTDHLNLLAAPSILDKTIDLDEGSFEGLIDFLRKSAPVTVIDMPHVWNGWTRKTLIDADQIVITATPDLTSLRNAKNLVDMAHQARPNDAPPILVLNQMNLPKRPEISAADFENALGIAPVATIPFDAELFGNAANNGQMIAEVGTRPEISDIFDLIAQVATGRGEVRKTKRSGLASLAPLMEKFKIGKKA